MQFAATVERTLQRFSHFECVSSLCIVICDALITNTLEIFHSDLLFKQKGLLISVCSFQNFTHCNS